MLLGKTEAHIQTMMHGLINNTCTSYVSEY
jgi:hypothetical protein